MASFPLARPQYARGRNGGFVPRTVEVHPTAFPGVLVEVFAHRTGRRAPVQLMLDPADAARLAAALREALETLDAPEASTGVPPSVPAVEVLP